MQDSFRRTLLLNIGIIILSFALLFLLARFMAGKLSNKGAQVLEMRSSVYKYAVFGDRLAFLKDTSLQAEEYEKKMELFLPLEDQLLGFKSFLEDIAKRNHVDLTFNFLPNTISPATETNAGSIKFSIQSTGPYQNLSDFMEEIEKKTVRFWIGLDSMEIVKSGDGYILNSQGKVFFK